MAELELVDNDPEGYCDAETGVCALPAASPDEPQPTPVVAPQDLRATAP